MIARAFWHFSSLFTALLLSLYFISVGRSILKHFERKTSFIENVAFSFPLGTGFASTVVFLLGLIVQIRFWPLLSFILATWLFSLRETFSFLKELKQWVKTVPGKFSSRGVVLLCLLSAHGLLNLIYGLGPPVGFDATYYHLVMARRYAESHFLITQPDIYWSFGPQLQEMAMTLGMTLHSDLLASLLTLASSFWIVISLYQLGKRFLGPEGALLAATLFWCMPLVMHYAPLMKNDLGTTVFLVLACDRWFLLSQAYSARRFFLLSILLGLAVACKFTAIPSVLIIGLLALWSLRKQKSTPHIRRVLALGFLFFASVCLPYFIRSYLLTGNPVYPNAYRLFGGRLWDPGLDEVFLKRHIGTKSLSQFLTYPIRLSLGEIYGGHVGTPLFLAFLPLLFLWRPFGRPLKRLLWISFLIYAVSYLFFDIHTRYFFPVICFLTIPTAYAIQKTWEEKGGVNLIGLFCVGVFLIFNLSVTYVFTKGRIPVAFGLESRSSYLSRTLPYYPVIAYVNTHTKPADRILITDLPGYYLERSFHHSSRYSGEILYYTLQSSEKLSERLQELRITYVIRTEKPMALLNWELLDELKQRGVLVWVYEKNGYALYRFQPRGG